VLKDVLLIGTNREDLTGVDDQLRDIAEIRSRTLLVHNASNGLLRRSLAEADLIVLCCRSRPLRLLSAVDALAMPQRPPILVCGDLNTPEETKLLVRIGVADLLPSVPTTDELQAAVWRALRNHGGSPTSTHDPRVITAIGAAGGVGASFIACNLAHILQTEAHQKTLLIDLDRAYAPITAMLDLKPTRGIEDAVTNLHTLDALALDGYTTRHESGLHLLASTIDSLVPRAVSSSEMSNLLSIIKGRHDLIIVAANRWLDEASIEALVQSQCVLTILRPELADLRSARRLHSLLTTTMGLNEESIHTVINRHPLRPTLPDSLFQKALAISTVCRIPEDTALVRHSIDSGTPIMAIDRDAAASRALLQLANILAETPIPERQQPFARFWRSFTRSDKHP
jgi:pilus assembly protein CpaE